LAHFRGDLTPEERRTVKFSAEWLENHLPIPTAETALPPPVPIDTQVSPPQEEAEGPQGSYAPLAAHLEALSNDTTSLSLTFQQIEDILKKELPRSAFEYRAWWSNDPMKPQSAAWLEEGWRTTSVNMTERRLTFVRTNDREEAYIRFFAKLNARLAMESDFPLRNHSPQGQNWLVLASLDRSRPEVAKLVASFARRKRLRIEVYLDYGDKEQNKQRFGQLLKQREEIERLVGEPLEWERLDKRQACRIAIYTKAQILMDADSPVLLNWAAKRATSLYRAFETQFCSSSTIVTE
jgi:hypothetical protein